MDMKQKNKIVRNNLFGYKLIAPTMIYLVIFMLIPFCWAVWTSFTNKRIGSSVDFVGFENFVSLIQDKVFIRSVKNTIIYTVGAVVGKLVLGMIIALVLNAAIPFRNICRVLLFVPWTIPTLVSALTWKWMFSDVGGLFNYLFKLFHLSARPIPWLYNADLAMGAIITANIWRGAPFIGISILAGLQAIPRDYYEAAKIDGANALHRFAYITLPLVKEVTILSTLITTIWTFNDFEMVWILTGGGPSNATQIISTYGYTVGFMNLNLSKAISSSVIAIPFLIILTTIITKRMRNSAES